MARKRRIVVADLGFARLSQRRLVVADDRLGRTLQRIDDRRDDGRYRAVRRNGVGSGVGVGEVGGVGGVGGVTGAAVMVKVPLSTATL